MISVIITAGGSGKRLPGKVKKQFLEIGGKPVLFHTIERFLDIDIIDEIVISLPQEDVEEYRRVISSLYSSKPILFVAGGSERQQSVFKAIKCCNSNTDTVLIHDGVRPFFGKELVNELLKSVSTKIGVIPVSRVKHTLKECENGLVKRTVPRENLFNVHTPQCFKYSDILELHLKAEEENRLYTDDASLFEMNNYAIKIVEDSDMNIKITTVEDLNLAKFILEENKKQLMI